MGSSPGAFGASGKAIGARLLRKEDDRFLHGRGQYIGDIRLPGMREIAFVRSPVAHARLTGVHVPAHLRASVFTARDLTGVLPIRAVSSLPGFQASEQPVLAGDRIRQVGELIAFAVADSRGEAEDIAAQVNLEYEELPAVVDMREARRAGAAQVHDTIRGNVFIEVGYDGDVEAVARTAPVKVTRELRTARQVMSPIECRGFIAQWDARLHQLVLHGATQFPHVVRTGLAEVLQFEGRARKVLGFAARLPFAHYAILLWMALVLRPYGIGAVLAGSYRAIKARLLETKTTKLAIARARAATLDPAVRLASSK